ncbi:uncharacterized protein BO97DRAFT_445901 [Aspergillus homomorphus CBS 101889]|uniref:Uncharacterized protein n=1 Tax=Aspergillus homomorphus (strain CBS 101889) TaxID=1450537 RepID=A0A395HPV5_ASPHC|nr:hypothetical protein BO97DRAFT_445901 [Aspergillus homomorphus CBS 101889]RAL08888.1 hypothetical protein BO97DRAFT_445901 [Aspergillus homomorphus CBS 101889]
MDKLGGIASKLGGSHGSSNNNQKEDYVDKGVDNVESRFGADPQKLRSTNEKATDFARNKFESSTGHHVPDKISN